MKKILLTLSLVSSLSFLFAQSTKFGIKAGLNGSTLSSTSNGQTSSTSSNTGFHLGAFGDFNLGGPVSIQPGLLYTSKGGKAESSGSQTISGTTYTSYTNEDFTINYLEIPVN